MKEKYKSNAIVPISTTYIIYDSEGHDCGSLYLEKGSKFPATQDSGSYYMLG